MTKDSNDLLLEHAYASDNDYWKKGRRRRTVYIPKKLGRNNPALIKTDSFDFAKITDAINTIGTSIEKVSTSVTSVANTVNTAAGSVKNVVNTVKGKSQPTVNTPFIPNAGYSNVNPGYNQPTLVTANAESMFGGINPLLIGGVLIALVVLFVFKK